VVDPANQVVLSDVPDKEQKAVGGLVEATASEATRGYWAVDDVLRLRQAT
jgi:hypothetical protein